MPSAADAAAYLARYVDRYRREYAAMTAQPPEGGGYPDLSTSPYLRATSLIAYVALDGAAIADYTWEPPGQWEVAGGPTLLVDYEPTRTPVWVHEVLSQHDLVGQNIGIYRIVSPAPLGDAIWAGRVPPAIETASARVGTTYIEVGTYDISLEDLVARLTFGAFGRVLDLRFPPDDADFWDPHVVRDLGFAPADRHARRFFHYLELLHHGDQAAWDPRSAGHRAYVDSRRDFAASIGTQPGGTIQVPRGAQAVSGTIVPQANPFEVVAGRVLNLSRAIDEFRSLVESKEQEARYQELLEARPELLDAYGIRIHARPRLRYPEGEKSPVGKRYVEPDFVIEYPGRRYALVELERPETRLGTQGGQPSAQATTPAFQLAEWRSFITQHPNIVEELFPGLPHDYTTMVVMSRSTDQAGRDPVAYRRLIASTYNVDDLFYYDELAERAEVMLARLTALGIDEPPA